MKLTQEQVEKICKLIIENLKAKELILFKTDEKTVMDKIVGVFISNLKQEEELDKEVDSILSTHAATIDSQRVDSRRMFQMIKRKLAKERGIIL